MIKDITHICNKCVHGDVYEKHYVLNVGCNNKNCEACDMINGKMTNFVQKTIGLYEEQEQLEQDSKKLEVSKKLDIKNSCVYCSKSCFNSDDVCIVQEALNKMSRSKFANYKYCSLHTMKDKEEG